MTACIGLNKLLEDTFRKYGHAKDVDFLIQLHPILKHGEIVYDLLLGAVQAQ